MQHQVLILSRATDAHIERLVAELALLGQPWVLFDPGDFPEQIDLLARFGEGEQTGRLILPSGEIVVLEHIGSIWYRRPTPLRAPSQLPPLQRTFLEREARAGLWGMLRAIDGLWVNHPDAIREASSKPRQLALAHTLGLSVPRTLITNHPDAFRQFYEECQGHVVYTLLGFPSYEVEEGVVASTFTSLVSEQLLQEAHRIQATAHLFQEFVPKMCDIRVIVIGTTFFAVEIYPLSEETRIDFRRDYRALRYAVHHLPPALQQALSLLTAQYRLHYAAIDLLYTPEKRYIFLEINPVGQLGWLEEPTGLPLFKTLARFLAQAP